MSKEKKEVKEYVVLEDFILSTLVKEVTDSMSHGWTPQGGVFAKGGMFYQAMIRTIVE